MKQHHVPIKISQYIKRYYPGAVHYKVTPVIDPGGRVYYDVELALEEILYQLKFNEAGTLIRKAEEEAFPDEDRAFE